MDPPADQANLHDVSYPSRCWILISEIREYERNRTNLNFFDQFGDFNPIGGMLFSAEALLYEYTTYKTPHLNRITRRIGTVPYTLRVTLFMILTLCSKLSRPHIVGHEAQLERILDAFVGGSETRQVLRAVLEQANSYRPFDVAPKDASISYFYTEVFCSLINGTPEVLYPGATDTLRAYFANVRVDPPIYEPGEPVWAEEEEFVSLGGGTRWDWLFSPHIPTLPSTSFSWPKAYYDLANVIITPAVAQSSFQYVMPFRFQDEGVAKPGKVYKPNKMGIILTPLHPFRTRSLD